MKNGADNWKKYCDELQERQDNNKKKRHALVVTMKYGIGYLSKDEAIRRLKEQNNPWANEEISKIEKCHRDKAEIRMRSDEYWNPQMKALREEVAELKDIIRRRA